MRPIIKNFRPRAFVARAKMLYRRLVDDVIKIVFRLVHTSYFS